MDVFVLWNFNSLFKKIGINMKLLIRVHRKCTFDHVITLFNLSMFGICIVLLKLMFMLQEKLFK